MGLFGLIRGSRGSSDLSLDALIKALSSKAAADKIYDPDWAPEGGWDAWCAWAYRQGKVHRSVNPLAKNAMAYELAAAEGDEAAARPIFPAPLISMLKIFWAVSRTTSMGMGIRWPQG